MYILLAIIGIIIGVPMMLFASLGLLSGIFMMLIPFGLVACIMYVICYCILLIPSVYRIPTPLFCIIGVVASAVVFILW